MVIPLKAGFPENPRFSALASLAAFLHGKTLPSFPDPFSPQCISINGEVSGNS